MKLDEILEISVDVLRDYQDDAAETRLPRLARYVAETLGGEPAPGMPVIHGLTPRVAREMAVALLRWAEEQECSVDA